MKTVRKESDVNVKAYIRSNQLVRRHPINGDCYQSFPTDRFNKTIDYFCNEFGSNFGSPNHRGVPLHASFPVDALLCHCWNRIRSAEVVLVLKGAHGHFLHNVCLIHRNVSESTSSIIADFSPIEYSEIRCSTSRCTVRINWRARYRNSRIRHRLKKN
jgi:hypothetical protein